MSKDIASMFMSKNAVGHFEEVCSQVESLGEDGQDDRAIIEFLKASIELGCLRDYTAVIDRLKDEKDKQLFRNYTDSLCKQDIAQDKIESAMQWLENWMDPIMPEGSSVECQSIENFITIAIPTCLNIASKIPHDGRRNKLLEKVESIVEQNFVPQPSIPPNHISPELKIYSAVLKHLKGNNLNIIGETMTDYSKDLRLNHLMYRTLKDLNIFEDLRHKDLSMESIELNACKYNCCNKNFIYANSIAEKLISRDPPEEIRYLVKLMSLKAFDTNHDQKVQNLFTCAKELQQSRMQDEIKTELGSKILRQVIRSSGSDSDTSDIHLMKCLNLEILTDKESSNSLDGWNKLLSKTSIDSQVKTLKIFSLQMIKKFESQPENYALLNDMTDIDLKLLVKICQSNNSSYRSSGLATATSILKNIREHWSKLNDTILDTLESQEFFDTTQRIWFQLRTNLLSVIAYKKDFGIKWKQAIINIVKRLSSLHPNAFIYDILVNRLDLMGKLQLLGDRSSPQECNSTATLLLAEEIKTSEEQTIFKQDCKRQLDFWNSLSDHLSKSIDDWSEVFTGTERFIREIRRVSYLCGEYLSNLATRIPRDFNNFRTYMKKHCNTSELIDKNRQLAEAKFIKICNNHQKAIETLLDYKKVNSLTQYEIWFFDTFGRRLRAIAKEFRSLASQRPIVDSDTVESSFAHIRWELLRCEMDINNYNHTSRQQYFMEMISPLLSRMPPSSIPMPGCHSTYITSAEKSKVTIHKIYQTVQLIASKNSPKKLRFVGSDGVVRPFLLKSHDDLRLDQFLMEVFASINTLLSSSKTTMKNYQIKQYSVVPVSSRSGLIQWIDAPSLSSSYRAWAAGPKGAKVIKKLYQDTCRNVCYGGVVGEPNPKHECDIPEGVHIMHPFRRVLQSKMPNPSNAKDRTKVDLRTRESCVSDLMRVMPNQLISDDLLHSSPNSYSFWIKTNTFTASWALMCIVGYIIGLGDRHLDNMLLDKSTGEIIHIDYNICFELGKQLSVPEKVPFRLTRNVIHAFGSAGIEGRFILDCRRVLKLLRDNKTLLLNLLDPINLSFMISDRDTGRDASAKDESNTNVYKVEKFVDPITEMPRSQEDETTAMKSSDSSELGLQLNRALESHKNTARLIYTNGQVQVLEHNIKTPTRLSPMTTMNIYKRISQKISGTDYESEIKKNHLDERTIENIEEPRKVEDQIDALIQEATSMQNLAAMYEGWAPWL